TAGRSANGANPCPISACHTPTALVATAIATLIGSQRGVSAGSLSTRQASASMPTPRTQRPIAVDGGARVASRHPKASLDPNANAMLVAIPTAVIIEPISPNNSAYRFDRRVGVASSPIAAAAKLIAAGGNMRPGLDCPAVTYHVPKSSSIPTLTLKTYSLMVRILTAPTIPPHR